MTADAGLLDELRWVHRMVRQDLATCRKLARSVTRGMPAARVRTELHRLRTRGPLFELKVNCLRYCRFVHLHHGLEDATLFPSVRAAAPELGAAVDKLEADHRRVAALLDEVEAAARALSDGQPAEVRERLADALDELARHLLEHLAYEENVLGPVLSSWRTWPWSK